MEIQRERDTQNADVRIKEMMDMYGTSLLRMCYLYLGDRELSQDAVQETFLKAYRKLDTFRGASAEKTWLMRIAINTCNDYHRSAWSRLVDRRVPLEDITPASNEAPHDDTVITEVMRLPKRDREVVLLKYYQQMKVWEISEALGIPKGTVTSRLNRARQKLHQRLKGWYFDE